jgi:chromosome segregation ATPase
MILCQRRCSPLGPPCTPVRTSTSAPVQAEDSTREHPSAEVQALKNHIDTLKGLLVAEVERTQEARAEADHAKADQTRMARDVATMFDELKAMADRHAELHADRARLQAELDQARTELARARWPLWRRLIGR